MGVRMFETDSCDTDEECLSCFGLPKATAASKKKSEQQRKLNTRFHNNQQEEHYGNYQAINLLSAKDLVGNSKEFRIEHNKLNLRIIGNGNRIRINKNSGNLQIIGNSTKLKITKNSGNIKYTGNEGRICLGSESTHQSVDYIGCDGLLKVVNSMELNKSPQCSNISKSNSNNKKKSKTNDIGGTTAGDKVSNNSENNNKSLPGNTVDCSSSSSSTNTTSLDSIPSKMKVKSVSYGGSGDFKNAKWQEFNELLHQGNLQNFSKVSLPNLKENLNNPSSNCDCKCKNKSDIFNNKNKAKNIGANISNSPTNVVRTFGDIVIKNSVNISIA